MEANKINQLADILENKVTSRNSNNSLAATIFRDTQCVYNDYRSVKMLNMIFNYMIQKFRIEEGVIKLTNTSKNIGDIVINVLNARESNSTDAKSIMMGDFILDILIAEKYLILTREPFFRVEEVYSYGKKKKINYNPYKLEMGENFIKVSTDPKQRIGISLHKYKNWNKGKRKTQGVEEKLIKSNIKIDNNYKEAAFMQSINKLEKVRWKINPDIARISNQLKKQLIDTKIELVNESGETILFNSIDLLQNCVNPSPSRDIKFSPFRINKFSL